MSESTQQLITSALQLSPTDRVVVANAILASLDGAHVTEDQPSVHDAWADAIRKRIIDIDNGHVKTIPSSEAWKMIDGETEIPD